MKQYCRYCCNCIYGDGAYCDATDKFMSDEQVKRTNTCKYFEFNPIDVFAPDKTYKPRKKKDYKQQKLF